MIVNDKILGRPIVLYTNTDTIINSIVAEVGAIAYTTDTHRLLIYNGTDWVEVTGTGGGDTWSHNETPTGTINGINVTFTLAHTPLSWIQLYLNGVILEPGAGNDYTLSGSTVTMLFAPATGDKLRVYYIYQEIKSWLRPT